MFITVIFAIAKIWNNLSAHQQMNGLKQDVVCGIYIYLYNGVLSAVKKVKSFHLQPHGWTSRV